MDNARSTSLKSVPVALASGRATAPVVAEVSADDVGVGAGVGAGRPKGRRRRCHRRRWRRRWASLGSVPASVQASAQCVAGGGAYEIGVVAGVDAGRRKCRCRWRWRRRRRPVWALQESVLAALASALASVLLFPGHRITVVSKMFRENLRTTSIYLKIFSENLENNCYLMPCVAHGTARGADARKKGSGQNGSGEAVASHPLFWRGSDAPGGVCGKPSPPKPPLEPSGPRDKGEGLQ